MYALALYAPGDDEDKLPGSLPPETASEIKSIDAMRRAIEACAPIERWQFDGVRIRYQTLLKTGSTEPALEEVVRGRLEQLKRLEQAARAAAAIQTILAQSHRRDRDLVHSKRQRNTSATRRVTLYQAVGFMQPSTQKVDGRKLFVLIGKNGKTVAFLDIPPGLDPDPALARRVGVRGVVHYDEDLQSRLITVRDLEPLESRR